MKDTTSKLVSYPHPPLVSSSTKANFQVPKTSMPFSKPTPKVKTSSLIKSFRYFDIIDHAKRTKIQMSKIE
jgi:hypothetical protein